MILTIKSIYFLNRLILVNVECCVFFAVRTRFLSIIGRASVSEVQWQTEWRRHIPYNIFLTHSFMHLATDLSRLRVASFMLQLSSITRFWESEVSVASTVLSSTSNTHLIHIPSLLEQLCTYYCQIVPFSLVKSLLMWLVLPGLGFFSWPDYHIHDFHLPSVAATVHCRNPYCGTNSSCWISEWRKIIINSAILWNSIKAQKVVLQNFGNTVSCVCHFTCCKNDNYKNLQDFKYTYK
jgi:hypothetical protein